jgi:hypothetical protein
MSRRKLADGAHAHQKDMTKGGRVNGEVPQTEGDQEVALVAGGVEVKV